MSKELEMLDQELKLLKQQKDNLLRKQARAKTDNETKYWQWRIDKFNEKINLFNYIKTSLQRLEKIDNADISEALEIVNGYDEHDKIEDFDVVSRNTLYYYQINVDCMENIKNALLKAQENTRSEEILQKFYQEGITLDSVRALKQEKDNLEYENKRLIKESVRDAKIAEHQHNVLKIIKEKEVNMQVFNQCEDVEVYNNVYKKQEDRQLTEEEFNSIRGV